MKITKLVLHFYKRFFLNNINTVTYTPGSKIQILLGQNGSGKSSLLEQLTPLPPNLKKDFNDGGYKEIHIEHNGSQYVLVSNKPSTHSFLKDNTELNTGHTLKVQTTLVEQHFSITPHIQQVLLGKNVFCNMTPAERKRWISHLSDIDYSYAIGVYNNLKQRHRDLVGGIKLTQANVFKLDKAKLSVDNITKLRNDKKHLTHMIDQLLLGISEVPDTNLDQQLTNLQQILRAVGNEPTATSSNIEAISKNLEALKIKEKINTATLHRLYHDLTKLEEVVPEEQLDAVTQLVSKLEQDIEYTLSVSGIGNVPELEDTHRYLSNKSSDIISFITALSEHISLDISTSTYKELTSTLDKLLNDKRVLDKQINLFTAEIQHIESHTGSNMKVTCPDCDRRWVISKHDTDHAGLHKLRDAAVDKFTRLSTLILDKQNVLQDTSLVRDIVKGYFRYFNYNAGTKYLKEWALSAANKLGYEHTNLPQVFAYIMSELKELNTVVTMQAKITQLEQTKKEMLVKTNTKREHIIARANELNDSIARAQEQNKAFKSNVIKLEKELSAAVRLDSHILTLQSNVSLCYKQRDAKLKYILNEGLKLLVKQLRLSLLDVDQQLKTVDETDSRSKQYAYELTDLQHKEKLLKITLRKLSPSEGLIAKSINSFLNEFISDMNYTIASIWGYQMEILSCDLLDNDLDYKFKVLVNGTDVMEDVSKTSSSMQEIINLVFKLAFSKYANYIDYPLILDEFGKTFDAQHRVTAYDMLDRKILLTVSQIYIVSHFTEMYGRFGNSDISILGTAGVEMAPVSEYNEVMDIQ